MWLWVSLPYATYAIEVRGGVVTTAPSIAKWMLGKDKETVKRWLEGKGADVRKLQE